MPDAPPQVAANGSGSSPASPVQIAANGSGGSPASPVQISANGGAGSPSGPPGPAAPGSAPTGILVTGTVSYSTGEGVNDALPAVLEFAGLNSAGLPRWSNDPGYADDFGSADPGYVVLNESESVSTLGIKGTDGYSAFTTGGGPAANPLWDPTNDETGEPTTTGTGTAAAPPQIASNGSAATPAAPPAIV